MSNTKSMTLRLENEMSEKLEVVSNVLDKSVSDCVRDSLDEWFGRLQADEEFNKKFDDAIERTNQLFGRRVKSSRPARSKATK